MDFRLDFSWAGPPRTGAQLRRHTPTSASVPTDAAHEHDGLAGQKATETGICLPVVSQSTTRVANVTGTLGRHSVTCLSPSVDSRPQSFRLDLTSSSANFRQVDSFLFWFNFLVVQHHGPFQSPRTINNKTWKCADMIFFCPGIIFNRPERGNQPLGSGRKRKTKEWQPFHGLMTAGSEGEPGK